MVISSLCLFGAAFGLWIFKLDFSITAVLGLISLIGIIVRNGIILFDYAEELRTKGKTDIFQAAMDAGKRRMRPIFLTSSPPQPANWASRPTTPSCRKAIRWASAPCSPSLRAAACYESRLLDLLVESKRLEKKIAIGGSLPQIGAGFSYGYSNLIDRHTGRFNGVGFVTLQIPITGAITNAQRIRKSNYELEKALNTQEYATAQLRLQLQMLQVEMETAWDCLQNAAGPSGAICCAFPTEVVPSPAQPR